MNQNQPRSLYACAYVTTGPLENQTTTVWTYYSQESQTQSSWRGALFWLLWQILTSISFMVLETYCMDERTQSRAAGKLFWWSNYFLTLCQLPPPGPWSSLWLAVIKVWITYIANCCGTLVVSSMMFLCWDYLRGDLEL